MSYLYAVRMLIPDYAFQPIKIGYSVDPPQRFKKFTTMPFPLEWLGQWDAPNGYGDEAVAHKALAPFRLCGEWFLPSAEVLDFISAALGEKPSVILNEKKVARFQDRYDAINVRPEVTVRHVHIDPFDVSEWLTVPLLERIAELKAKWPQVPSGPCWLPPDEVTELSGLSEEILARLPRLHIGKITRYSLRSVVDYLTSTSTRAA